MPTIWQNVDSNFPSFHGDEGYKEMIPRLLNYMQVLTEQLKYTLANLNKSNWNGTALAEYTEENTGPIIERVEEINQQLNGLRQSINGLGGRVSLTERDIEELVQAEKAIEQATAALKQRATALEMAMSRMEMKADVMEQFIEVNPDDGSISIGGTGKIVYMEGTIYINGQPVGG